MTIPDDAFTGPGDEVWPQRGRGGWMRNFHGQAVVSHPDGGKRTCAYDGGSSFWPFTKPYAGDPIHGERGTFLHSLCNRATETTE